MKTLFRWAFRLCILLLVLLAAAVLLLDTVAREFAEYRLSRETGLEVKIGKVNIGLFNPRVTVEHLVIYNSAEFGGSPLLDLPELHVEYDLGALWSHKLHCRLVRLNLARGTVVENKAGRLNLETFAKRAQKTGGPASPNPKPKAAAGYQFLGVDTLNLTLGQVDFLSLKNPAQADTLKIGVHNQVMTNYKSPESFEALYLWVLLRNGVDLTSKDNGNPNDRWHYWREKLGALEKK